MAQKTTRQPQTQSDPAVFSILSKFQGIVAHVKHRGLEGRTLPLVCGVLGRGAGTCPRVTTQLHISSHHVPGRRGEAEERAQEMSRKEPEGTALGGLASLGSTPIGPGDGLVAALWRARYRFQHSVQRSADRLGVACRIPKRSSGEKGLCHCDSAAVGRKGQRLRRQRGTKALICRWERVCGASAHRKGIPDPLTSS